MVAQARATLSTDETNLSKASIRSPIDGVVLARSVDPGNAVAASLQAVTLFTLGEDLRQLTLDASVDEADVGAVQTGQTGRVLGTLTLGIIKIGWHCNDNAIQLATQCGGATLCQFPQSFG